MLTYIKDHETTGVKRLLIIMSNDNSIDIRVYHVLFLGLRPAS